MRFLRNALALALLAVSTIAVALTPTERVLLFGKIKPVWTANFLTTPFTWSWSGSAWVSSPAGLTYAGQSLKWQFDSAGKLTTGPNNILTYSNTFNNSTAAGWVLSTATITTGISDPFGGTNASTLTAVGGAGSINSQVNALTSYTNLQYIWIRRRTGTGQILFRSGGAYNDVTSSVTSSWSILVGTPFTGSPNALYIALLTNGDAVDIYGAVNSIVTYETSPRSGDQVLTQGTAFYGPRQDYTYNGSAWVPAGLLMEQASSGNLYKSTNSPATQTTTVVNGTTYTVSFYGTGSIVLTGAASQTLTGAANTRTTYTFTAGSTSLTSTMSGLGSTSYPQLEPYAFALSYIPNPTASSPGPSRAADVVSLNGVPLAALQGAQGTVFVQTTDVTTPTTAAGFLGNSISSNRPIYYFAGGNTIRTYNGTNVLDVTGAPTLSAPIRAGVAWSAAGRSITFNGKTVATDANAFMSGATTAGYLGNINAVPDFWINGHLASTSLYNQRLPDPTFKAKSVVGAPY